MKRPSSLLIAAAIALLSSAHAQPPSAAFDYVSTDTVMALNDVERAAADLGRSRLGLSGALNFDPDITYGGPVDEAAEFDFGFTSDLSVDYRFDSAAILADEIDLLRAEARLADRRLADVETALLAHTDLLRAAVNIHIRQADLETEQADFDAAQAEVDAGEATAAQLEDARINRETARITLERAQAQHVAALSNAVRLGVGPNPSFAILRFQLPDAAPEQTFTYRQLVLALRRADALGLQNGAFGVLEEITLGASYGTDNVNAGVNANLNRGRPGVGIDASYEYPDDDPTAGWEIKLGLSLRIDDSTPRDFAGAERNLAEGQRDLEAFLNAFSADAIGQRQDAEFAWQELGLSLRDFENTRVRLGEVRARLETLPGEVEQLRERVEQVRAERDAATGEERSNLDQQVRDADSALRDAEADLRDTSRELGNLERDLPRNEDALYRDWVDYVRAVGDYLAVVDGVWAVAE